MRLNIRAKIIGISAAILFLVIGVNTWVNGLYFTREYSKTLQSEVFIIANTLKSQLDRLLRMHIPINQLEGFEDICRDIITQHPYISYAMVVNPYGRILFHNDPVHHNQVITDARVLEGIRAKERIVLTTRAGSNGKAVFDFFIPVNGTQGEHIATIRTGFPIELVTEKTRKMALSSIGTAIASLVVGITLLILVLNLWVAAPIDQFVNTIQEIRKNWSDPARKVEITSKDEIGKLAGAFNQMTTELRRTTVSKNYVDKIIGNMLNSLIVTDRDRVIQTVNQATLDLLGYQRDELVGRPLDTILVSPGDVISTATLQTTVETGLISKGRKEIPALFSSSILKNNQGRSMGFICVAQDITRLKAAEKEKIEAQNAVHEHKKLALIGQIAGKMAHDFNNILGAIMGIAELEIMDCRDEKIIKSLEMIFQQTIRGKNLTRNLVAFAKSQELKPEYFRITDTIDSVISLMHKELRDIRLRVEAQPELPDLLADPDMIEHTLINLLQNAIHAVSNRQNPEIRIQVHVADGQICIRLRDNGCGIPPEYLDRIYDPSFTLKGSRDLIQAYGADIKGTGYGLSNVKKYIDQHKGGISVDSDRERGTCFTLCLPVAGRAIPGSEKKEIIPTPLFTGKRILILEDEPDISQVQKRILTQAPCSHQVDLAETGEAVLGLFKENAYDFISLDYILPGRMNGLDVYKEIRSLDQGVPILFASGNIEFLESIDQLKQEDPLVDHISKPFHKTEYMNCLNRLMAKAAAYSQAYRCP